MRYALGRTPACAFLLIGVCLLCGCDNTIEPFAEKGSYSVYGYLSPSRDLQFIRVKPLTTPVPKLPSRKLDATVMLENVTQGTSVVLQDSIIPYRDAESEVMTHNYLTDTPITLETKYRLTVEGPAGERVEATTITPTRKDADPNPDEGDCLTTFTVHFKGVSDQRRIRAKAEVKYVEEDRKDPWLEYPLDVFTKPDGRVVVTFEPNILISGDVPSPGLPPGYSPFCWIDPPCLSLDSDKIRVQYAYLGPEWYGDIPDDSLTYDPLSSYDVSNGLGFFGSLRRDQTFVRVDTSSFIRSSSPFCN